MSKWLPTDEEIRNCLKEANDEAQLYGDDGLPNLLKTETSYRCWKRNIPKLSN